MNRPTTEYLRTVQATTMDLIEYGREMAPAVHESLQLRGWNTQTYTVTTVMGALPVGWVHVN